MLQKHAVVFGARATTAQLYPGRDTFEFNQGHVTKNQPITVLEYRIDPRGYEHHWTSSWNKDWKKNSGPYGIWTHDLCDTGAALYLTSQLRAGYYVGSK